jgi:uncharacterized protein YegL
MHELEPVVVPNLVSAPAWLQLALIVVDGSGSMTERFARPDASVEGYASPTKAAAVDVATRSLLQRMQQGGVAANFEFAYVSFNDRVTEQRGRERLLDVSLDRSYDPTAKGIGGTAIHLGLDAAATIVEGFMRDAAQSEVGASAVVVLMSDGEEQDDAAKVAASAARLCEIRGARLAACLFATDGRANYGEPLLQSIVSGPELYQRIYDTEQLRRFFHATLTKTGHAPAVRDR